MSLIRLVLLGLALVALANCNASATPTRTPTPALPTSSDLRNDLLTTSDLPAGWSVLSTSDRNSLSPSQCAAGVLPPQHVEATVFFQQPEAHLQLFETIAAFDSGKAKQWMDELQQNTNCTQTRDVSIQGTPATVTSTIAPLTIASMGEQMLAFRVTGMTTNQGTPSPASESGETDLVYVRVGDLIVQIWNYRVSNADTVPTTSIIEKAVDKITSSG